MSGFIEQVWIVSVRREVRAMAAAWLLIVCSLIAVALAFLFGEAEERLFAAAQALTLVADHLIGAGFTGERASGELLIDVPLFAVTILIALRSTKTWPLVAGALCGAAFMTEAAQVISPAATNAYVFAQTVWECSACAIVIDSIWRLCRARRAVVGAAPVRTSSGFPSVRG